MTDEQKKILEQTVTDVLERFTFMFTDLPEEFIDNWHGQYLHATITFQGTSQGVVCITASDVLCREIAANVLGELGSDEITEETSEDAVKELLNIICGELVAELFGTKDVFDLTVPSVVRIDTGKLRELIADGDNIKVLVDDQPLLVSMLIV